MALMELTGLVEPDSRPTTFKNDFDLSASTVDTTDCFACCVFDFLHTPPSFTC